MRVIKNYKPEVVSLWHRLVSAGFKIRGVSNDGENLIQAGRRTEEELIEELLGADEGWIFALSPTGCMVNLYLVYGNEPGVIVTDYTGGMPDLAAVVNEHGQEWEGKSQPMLEVE